MKIRRQAQLAQILTGLVWLVLSIGLFADGKSVYGAVVVCVWAVLLLVAIARFQKDYIEITDEEFFDGGELKFKKCDFLDSALKGNALEVTLRNSRLNIKVFDISRSGRQKICDKLRDWLTNH